MVGEEFFKKVRRILDALELRKVKFSVRRSETLDEDFVNLSENVRERFVELHEKYDLKVKNISTFPVSSGELEIEKFLKFLKEYDELFNLEYTVIDLGFLILNPSMF